MPGRQRGSGAAPVPIPSKQQDCPGGGTGRDQVRHPQGPVEEPADTIDIGTPTIRRWRPSAPARAHRCALGPFEDLGPMWGMGMPIIVLVDDDDDIVASLPGLLEADGYDVVVFTSAKAALLGFRSVQPDLAILAIDMTEISGVELFHRLRRESDLPIIFLTSRSDEVDELVALRVGGDDVIRKPFSQRVLVERVRAVMRRLRPKEMGGEKDLDQRVLERGELRMDRGRHTCRWKGRNVTLTATEFHLLEALAARPGVIKSRNALMAAAYDEHIHVDERTIDSHIKRLRRKLRAVDDSFKMIETIYGVGYRFREG
jgi:two-component system response regulator ChvI